MNLTFNRGVLAVSVTGAVIVAGVLLSQPADARWHKPVKPAGSAPSAAPHVQPFALRLGGRPALGPLARPSKVPVAPQIDGCDHDYGVNGQCVPWTFPPGVAATAAARCGWLAVHGMHGLKVRGTDRLGLDPRHRGVACPA
jgi:hypothetical protein